LHGAPPCQGFIEPLSRAVYLLVEACLAIPVLFGQPALARPHCAEALSRERLDAL
jgi:hypothetical protein